MDKTERASSVDTPDFHFERVQSELIKSIDSIKSKLQSTVSNATTLATLLEDPCLLKCITDLKSPTYGDGIDQFYTAKHDYARNSIIDKIAQEYSLRYIVGAEHVIKTGKLDVAISNNKIILCNGTKLIGIEIKTGSKTGPDVAQLIRYLFQVDVLIVVRVATTDVVVIRRKEIANELDRIALSIQEKAALIVAGEIYKVEGPWCRDCSADCEFRKNTRKSPQSASMEGLEVFIKNVGITVRKTLDLLSKELAE